MARRPGDPQAPARAPAGESPRARAPHRYHRLGYPGRILGAFAFVAIVWFESPPVAAWSDGQRIAVALVVLWPHLTRFVVPLVFPSHRGAFGVMLGERVLLGVLWPVLGFPLALLCLDLLVACVSSLAMGGWRLLAANAAALVIGLAAGLVAFGAPDALLAPSLPAFLVSSLFASTYAGIIGYLAYRQAIDVAMSRRMYKELSQSLEEKVEQRTAALRLANEAFRRFVPAEFLYTLGYEEVTRARLGDAIAKDVTILFADIRGFTALSEGLGPERTFAFLNACLSRLGPLVREHGGFIDKYIGDAIMALFPGGPATAVRAAAAMQRAIRDHDLQRQDPVPLAIGVGVHVGRVMMGTIGEEQRFEVTVISDAVNLTARLESLTRQFDCSVLVTGEVVQELGEQERDGTRWLGDFAVKGKTGATRIHELFTGDDAAVAAHKLASRPRFHAAIEHHQRGELEDAARLFAELVQGCAEDRPAAWWLARCRSELASGAAGPRRVTRLDEK